MDFSPDPFPRPTPAPALSKLIELLHEAANRLQRHGLGPYRRVRALRGLYYGTPHSLDFERRGSHLRNLGFNLYLLAAPPADPTPVLGATLVRALKDSAVSWHQDRWIDVGHVLVGMEARTRLGASRWAQWGHGGTGLELCTWLGDLGGAVGLLALQRLEDPSTQAVPMLFSEGTYDLRANLEGDVGGYLVGRDPAAGARISILPAERFVSVAQALEEYTQGRKADWADRWALFLRQLCAPGTRVDGALWRQQLLSRIHCQTRRFAACYLLYRLRHLGRLSRTTWVEALRHLDGAAAELSQLFLVVVEQGLDPAAARELPDLPASPPTPSRSLLAFGCREGGTRITPGPEQGTGGDLAPLLGYSPW